MKTIQELEDEIIEIEILRRESFAAEIAAQIMKAPACGTSKRSMLGLDRKHRKADTPLFEDTGLWGKP